MSTEDMNTFISLIIFLSIFVGSCVFAIGCLVGWLRHLKSSTNERHLGYHFRKYYLLLSGTDGETGRDYTLVSFDGGRNWFAGSITKLDDMVGQDFRLFGPADEIHPGLLVRLNGMERLMAHVTAHGSLNLNDPRDQALLEATGIESQKR